MRCLGNSRIALLFWRAWPVASPAGARPVERSSLSNKRCSLVCTTTFESSQPPLCRWLCLRSRTMALGQAPFARGLANAYGFIPPSGFLSQKVRAAATTTPISVALGLSYGRLATAGKETLAILRAQLRTRKFIRCVGLQRRNVCCTHRRRRAGELICRSRG
jgi:hypothetical protein